MTARLLLLLIGLFCALASSKLFVLPLREVMHVQLGLPADGTAFMVALMMLTHMLRPLLGVVIDASAQRGVGPRRWLCGAAAAAIASGLASVSSDDSSSGAFLLLALVVGCPVVVELVVTAALAAEQARGSAASLLGAARTFVGCTVVLTTGLGTGWIAEAPWRRLGPTVAVLMTLVFLSSPALAPVPPAAASQRVIRLYAPARHAAALAFLFYAIPGFSTLVYLKQRDELRFSLLSMGALESLNNLAGLFGVVAYYALRRRHSLPRLLPGAVVAYAVGSAAYLLYAGGPVAPAVEVVNGLLSAIGISAISEAVIRGAGDRGSALAIAIVLCAGNTGNYLSEILGGVLSMHFGLGYHEVIALHVSCYCVLAAGLCRVGRCLHCLEAEPTVLGDNGGAK